MGEPRPTNEIVRLGLRLLARKGEVHQSERAAALGIGAAQVNSYMRVAEIFGDKLPADRGLAIDLGALVVLAHPHVSEEVRNRAIARALGGERVTRVAAENMVAGIGQDRGR